MHLKSPIISIFCILLLGILSTPHRLSNPFTQLQDFPVSRNLALGDPWSTLWITPANDTFTALAVTVGAVFVTGYTSNALLSPSLNRDILLLKFSPEGIQLWNQTLFSTYDEAALALAESDSSLYLGGLSYRAGQSDGCLMKFDLNGNLEWNVTWGTSFDEWFNQVTIGTDGLYLCGISQKGTEDDADAILVKFDFDGTQLWNETWDMANVDKSADIAFAPDGIYLTGFFGSEWNSESDNVFLTKYSHSGVQIWNTTWGGIKDDEAYGLCLANQSIFVTGTTLSYSSSTSKELFLLEYDPLGNHLWNTTQPAGLHHSGLATAAIDEELYILGEYMDTDVEWQTSLLSLYTNTSQRWTHSWGGQGPCRPTNLALGVDSLYIVGQTTGWITNTTNSFLLKVGFDGSSAPGPIELRPLTLIDSGFYNASWTPAFDPDGTVTGYELQMATSPTFDWYEITWTTTNTSFLVTGLEAGLYYFRVRSRDSSILYGPWSNIQGLNVSLITSPSINPWLAPAILLFGTGAIVSIIVIVTIRRRADNWS